MVGPTTPQAYAMETSIDETRHALYVNVRCFVCAIVLVHMCIRACIQIYVFGAEISGSRWQFWPACARSRLCSQAQYFCILIELLLHRHSILA